MTLPHVELQVFPRAVATVQAPLIGDLGSPPSPIPDVPVTAVFLGIYLICLVLNCIIYLRNSRQGHHFWISLVLIGQSPTYRVDLLLTQSRLLSSQTHHHLSTASMGISPVQRPAGHSIPSLPRLPPRNPLHHQPLPRPAYRASTTATHRMVKSLHSRHLASGAHHDPHSRSHRGRRRSILPNP